MSFNKTLVANITLNSETLFITDRDQLALDGNTYLNVVTSWGDIEKYGNILSFENNVSNSLEIVLNTGEEYYNSGYIFSPTKNWNNSIIEIRVWEDGKAQFTDCTLYGKGVLKNYIIDVNRIKFSIDITDQRDLKLFPPVLVRDQSNDTYTQFNFKSTVVSNVINVTDSTGFVVDDFLYLENDVLVGEYARIKEINSNDITLYENLTVTFSDSSLRKNVGYKAFIYTPDKFINKTIPVNIGDLSDSDSGNFAKTIITDANLPKKICYDTHSQASVDSPGVWENGTKRFFEAKKQFSVTGTLSKASTAGSTYVYFNNPGLFSPGQRIYISDGANSETFVIKSFVFFVVPGGSNGDEKYGNYAAVADRSLTYNHSAGTVYKAVKDEYQIASNNNGFFSTSSQTLTTASAMSSGENVSLVTLEASDMYKLEFYDNTITDNDFTKLYQVVFTAGKEKMLLIQRPDFDNNQILVQRGFDGTTKEAHLTGKTLYLSDTYANRNVLYFRGRFDPVGLCNGYYSDGFYSDIGPKLVGVLETTSMQDALSDASHDKIEVIYDKDDSTYLYYKVNFAMGDDDSFNASHEYQIAMLFDEIELDAEVQQVKPAFKGYSKITGQNTSEAAAHVIGAIIYFTKSADEYNQITSQDTSNAASPERTVFFSTDMYVGLETSTTVYTRDTYSNLEASGSNIIPFGVNDPTTSTGFQFSTLKDLNNLPKIILASLVGGTVYFDGYTEFYIYNVGLWIDFFVDFTKENIVTPTVGRRSTSDLTTVTGKSSGQTMSNPVDVLAYLCLEELGYSTTEFTSNWSTEKTYFDNTGNFADGVAPKVAFSYGLEDSRVGAFEFCQNLASNFGLQIYKTDDNKIGLINVHEIYKNTPSTVIDIPIEDIMFLRGSGQTRMTIQQTGNELLYNDIIVKWRRNNSTDEYQDVYVLPETYTLEKSSITLATARTNYNNGVKSTLEIETPFIYNENDAKRLAEIIADDQAETHLFVTAYLYFDYYVDQGLSSQLERGQVISFVGSYGGVDFANTRKFYIQNVFYHDTAREIEIQCKSIDPISEF